MQKWVILGGVFMVAGTALFWGLRTPQAPKGPDMLQASVASIPSREAVVPRVPPEHPQKVPILTYHSIEPKPDHKEGVMQRHYRITPENFEKQMQYLKDNGYTPITFKTLAEYLSYGTTIPEKAIVLTFDDGWKSQYDYAVPVLNTYGFTATFFIITKSHGGGYMTWDEVRELANAGFEIASHTKTHAKLAALTDDASLKEELEGSKAALEENVGVVISTLAYPYYSHDDRVMKAAQAAGYSAARAGWTKFENSHEHLFELSSQEPVDDPNPFATKIKEKK